MLINPNGDEVNNLPHEAEFNRKKSLLTEEAYSAIVKEIQDYCDMHEAVRAAFFADRPSRSVLLNALRGDDEEAAKFHGQILWDVLRKREDEWWFHRPESIDGEIVGMAYHKAAA